MRKVVAILPFAPWGKNPPGIVAFPVPYTILKISAGVLAYERELGSADRTLLDVRFSAPRVVGTMSPSSLLPLPPSRFLSAEIRLVKSATVRVYGNTTWFFISYSSARITASCPASTPKSDATNYICTPNNLVSIDELIFINVIKPVTYYLTSLWLDRLMSILVQIEHFMQILCNFVRVMFEAIKACYFSLAKLARVLCSTLRIQVPFHIIDEFNIVLFSFEKP